MIVNIGHKQSYVVCNWLHLFFFKSSETITIETKLKQIDNVNILII